MRQVSVHMDVPYRSNPMIEFSAALLLRDYGQAYEPVTEPPVPVDAILENHLKLTFSFMNLREEFGVDDVHGALWIERREVGVDQRLDPEQDPRMEGRCNFTLAHEIGHWQMHRGYRMKTPAPMLPFAENSIPAQSACICRSTSKARVEIQANFFASALLMPKKLVFNAWRSRYGDGPLPDESLRDMEGDAFFEAILRQRRLPTDDAGRRRIVHEWVGAPLARAFHVSRSAMRIRLEQLGLLDRRPPGLWN